MIGGVLFRNSRRLQDSYDSPLAVIKPTGKSIAVLPFESLSDDRSDTYFADGVQDEILSDLSIQSDIAQKVASKLSARLSPEETKEIEEQPTKNLEAYDLYLQAKELITNAILGNIGDSRARLLDAIKLLEEATQRDASFALAYCLIAKADDWLYLRKFDEAGRRAHGDWAVNQALHFRPDLPEIYLAAAFHRYTCYRDYERARVQMAL